MHPELEAFLDLIQRHQLRLIIESNGVLITPRLAQKIARMKGFISISLDGQDAETHDRIRGVKGAFEKTLQGLQTLLDAGVHAQIIMTLMKENKEQIDGVMELGKKYRVHSLKFNYVQPANRGLELHRERKTLQIPEILDLYYKIKREVEPLAPFRLDFGIPWAFRSLKDLIENRQGECCRVKQVLGVLADGFYALCGIGVNEPDLVFGDARTDSLLYVWENHPVLQTIRNELPEGFEGVCRRCFFKAACFGTCIANNYHGAKKLGASHWICEQAYQLGLFPVQRLSGDVSAA